MPSVAWQPRNDMNNQNGSKVTNSTICMGSSGGKERPQEHGGGGAGRETVGEPPLRPLRYPALKRFHLGFRFKRRIIMISQAERRHGHGGSPCSLIVFETGKTSNGGHKASASSRRSSPPGQVLGNAGHGDARTHPLRVRCLFL